MTDLETIRLMREYIQELQQRNDELQQRNAQLEVIAALAQPLADAEIARMKKLVEDHEASKLTDHTHIEPPSKGGRPSNKFDDEFVLSLVNRSWSHLKANGMVDRVYLDSDAARFIAKLDLRAKDKNWVETEKTEAWKIAHKKSTHTWQNLISEMRTRQKTQCE